MKPGTQVVYVPSEADGNIFHNSCEFGFVTSEHPDHEAHFVRYWRKGQIGRELRTTANSELTYNNDMQEYYSTSQDNVDKQLILIKEQNGN